MLSRKERGQTKEKIDRDTKREGRKTASRQARERSTDQDENFLNESSSSEDDDETKPGAVEIAGPRRNIMETHSRREQMPREGSNSDAVVDNTNAPAMLVEADLAPELMVADQVCIQEEDDVIIKKKQYRRSLWFAMLFYGIAIILNVTGFFLLFLNPPPVHGPFYIPLYVGLPPAVFFLILATILIFLPTWRCCSSIRLENFAPDDKRLVRDAQIASAASLLLSIGAIPSVVAVPPDLQWLGYALMTWGFAGTVFAFLRVRLLLRSKETRQEMSKTFWVVFLVFFLALCGATVWRSIPTYPNCFVQISSWIGDGICDGGEYNTEECGYDGGDCINTQYPDCHADNSSKIGDGTCDGGQYMTLECGNDGGDCLAFAEKYPDCHVDQPYKIGDGFCDLCPVDPSTSPALSGSFLLNCTSGAYNTKACGYDGGDCDAVNKWYPKLYPDCHVEKRSRIGDGICDGRVYGTEECGFDGGDCLKVGERCRGHLECASEVCNVDTKVCDSS